MKDVFCSIPGCKNQAKVFALLVSSAQMSYDVAYCRAHLQNLGVDYFVPNPSAVEALTDTYKECRILAVIFSYEPEQYIFILKCDKDASVLLVQTGYIEASFIYQVAKKPVLPTPLTHEVPLSIIDSLGGSLLGVVVDNYDNSSHTYQCYLVIQTDNRLVNVRCRISDAIAIAIVSNKPVKVNAAFLGKERL